MTSVAASLASLPASRREAILAALRPEQLLALQHDWRFWARPNQLPPPGDWVVWVILAGRGFGKTRAGAEWAQEQAQALPGSHGALVGLTPGDARDTMVEGGPSAILKVSAPWFRPDYEPSKRRLTWPNGSWATVYSSKEYDKLRGPQHHWAWADELCSWHYPRETWDMLMMGLRLGEQPRCVVTTTPKPISLLRELVQRPTTAVTGGSSYENRANLSEQWFQTTIAPYEGTSLGQQEIYAAILDEAKGALWKRGWFEQHRVGQAPENPLRIVVALDPAGRAEEESNETGIVVAAMGRDRHGYVLADASGHYTPREWALTALDLFDRYRADRIVAETNQGGDMVEQTLRTVRPHVSYRGVWASKSKQARAEPVSALYEKGLVHHVGGFPPLEDQCVMWEPLTGLPSPDRLDALVWALTDLMLDTPPLAVPANTGLVQPSYWKQ